MTIYKDVVTEFAITLRNDQETFFEHFLRIANKHTKGSLTKEQEVWTQVLICTGGQMSAQKWFSCFRDKTELLKALRAKKHEQSRIP